MGEKQNKSFVIFADGAEFSGITDVVLGTELETADDDLVKCLRSEGQGKATFVCTFDKKSSLNLHWMICKSFFKSALTELKHIAKLIFGKKKKGE